MSFLDRLFGNDQITIEVEETKKKDPPAYTENDKLTLYSLTGEIVAELLPDTKVIITETPDHRHSLIQAKTASGTTTTIMSCDVPESPAGQSELTTMMRTFVNDIARARRNGSAGIRIPINEYELFAYIRNRPEIEVDLNKLEEAVNARQKSSILTDFINDMQANKRVDIYVAKNNIYNDEAERILRNACEKFSNIHFIEIKENFNVNVYWSTREIADNVRHTPDAVNIGIGIEGDKPGHTLALTNDLEDSVIAKAAFLVNHPLNVREEMLNAQYIKHAAGIMEVAKKHTMSDDVSHKVMQDLAIDEARYRHSDTSIQQYIEAAAKESYTDGHMRRIRVPFNDPYLALNLIPDAKAGILIEVGYEQIIFYGDQFAAKSLKDQHQWIDIGPYLAGHDTTKESYKIYEKQASEITVKMRFINDVSETLQHNVQKSVSESYRNVKALVERYHASGMEAEQQISLLAEVPELSSESYRKSIENIIREVLTKDSPFLSFGEIFRAPLKKNF